MTADNLPELGTLITQLLEAQTVTETYTYEMPVMPPASLYRPVERQHTVQFDALIGALEDAVIPSGDGSGPTGFFESSPAASMDALAVLDRIRRDSIRWTHTLHLPPVAHLRPRLQQLARYKHHRELVQDAQWWVTQARIAVGLDPGPTTLPVRCPFCNGKNTLVLAGDHTWITCQRCKETRRNEHVFLVAMMLEYNRTHATLAVGG